MPKMMRLSAVAIAGLLSAAAATGAKAQQQLPMTFFITSVGKGNGADLGGLAGADAHCAALAKAAGSTIANWRAYLSTTKPGGDEGDNARDRIGKGPWHNAKGVLVAKNVEDLHSDGVNINKQTALTEKGEVVTGSGETPNMHDILTGSDPDGRYSTAGGDTTCGNWTKSAEGSAIVGHHDRIGLKKSTRHMRSWNSSHGSRGCSQDMLKGSGGAGLFYCFAAN
jgi:cytochrome c556